MEKEYAWEEDSFITTLDGRLVQGIELGYGITIEWRKSSQRSISSNINYCL